VVERKNRTVMNMLRSLLKSMKVPGRFWGEAVRHSVYLLNRLPTKALNAQTPSELWNGKKPHLGHLKVFGSVGHVKNSVPHLKKLDDRSTPMVYFGVEQGSKAHRMYNPQTNKIVISRDVIFEESRSWQWDVNTEFFEGAEFSVQDADQFVTYLDISADVAGGDGVGSHQDVQGEQTSVGDAGVEASNPTGTESEGNSFAVPEPTTETVAVEPEYSAVGGADSQEAGNAGAGNAVSNNDYDEEPPRFRSLNEIYDETSEIELDSDSELSALLALMEEPANYKEAAGDSEWIAAMESEIQSIRKNGTWELATLPPGHKPIGLKWVFKLKRNSEGEVVKHKARLVAKG